MYTFANLPNYRVKQLGLTCLAKLITLEQSTSLNNTTMETNEKLLSLLFDKEAEIKELKDYIIQLQEKLQAIQSEYARLYQLHYKPKNAKKVLQRKWIGYKH